MILRNGGSIDDVVRITACDIPDEQLNKMKTLMEALNVKQPVYMLLEHEKVQKRQRHDNMERSSSKNDDQKGRPNDQSCLLASWRWGRKCSSVG